MAKMKFDAQKAKQFAVEKIEIVAMGVCTLLTVCFLITCVKALFTSSSEDQQIAANAKALGAAIDRAEPPSDGPPEKGSDGKDGPKVAKAKEGGFDPSWAAVSPVQFLTRTPLYDAAAAGDTKRRNPLILPIDVADRSGKEKYFQQDLVVAPVRWYVFNTRTQTYTVAERPEDKPGQGTPIQDIRTQRMAVVTATFPYQDQVALYLKALRIDKAEDLFNKGLAPMLAGLNVYRRSFDPLTNKTSDWEPIYVLQKDGKLFISQAVQEVLKKAVYDEQNVALYGHLYFPTAVTPLPALGDQPWPKLVFDDKAGIVAREEGAPGNTTGAAPMPKSGPSRILGDQRPMAGMPGDTSKDEPPAPARKELKAKKLGKSYEERLQGKINPFNPFGLYPESPKEEIKDDPREAAKAMQFIPLTPSGEQMKTFLPGSRKAPEKKMDVAAGKGPDENPYQTMMAGVGGQSETGKTLVRFFDTGLQPGKMYQYSVQVRMVNPNYGQVKEVAFPSLAEPKEILSAPVFTPALSVPKASHFYVVDQSPLETTLKGPKTIDREPKALPPHKAAVQIHQFVEEAGARGDEKKVCDWAIAERLLVERGETIGRRAVEVEIPTWDAMRSSFFLGVTFKVPYRGLPFKGPLTKGAAGGQPDYKIVRRTNVPVDFGEEENNPLVVDFEGGKTQYKIPGGTLPDEGNQEMLVLMPDGKMILRSSRADSDPEEPSGAERLRTYAAWRERLHHYREGGQSTERAKGP